MNDFAYPPEAYQLAVGEMSSRRRLIVEGKTDRIFFKILLGEFMRLSHKKTSKYKVSDIDIDVIDTLVKDDRFQPIVSGVTGNRKRIESIHKNTQNSYNYDKLFFFIDREFDDFTISLDKNIKDELNKHKVDGSLVWSRGHSIENYLFDFTVLRQPLRGLSDVELSQFEEAIQLFENNFYLTLRLGSAFSIALKECRKIKKLEEIINSELIDFDSSNVNLRLDELEKRICERKILSIEDSRKIINTYEEWYKKIEKDQVDIDTLRWICHGHIGIKVILAVYLSCINHCFEGRDIHISLRKDREPKKIMKNYKNDEDKICEILATWWADKAVRNECCYPQEVLEKLLLMQDVN